MLVGEKFEETDALSWQVDVYVSQGRFQRHVNFFAQYSLLSYKNME